MLASSCFLLSSVCCAVTRYVARSHPPGRQGLASSKRCQQSEDVPNIVRCRRIKFKSKGVSSVKLSGEETFFLLAFIWTKDINVSSKNALGREQATASAVRNLSNEIHQLYTQLYYPQAHKPFLGSSVSRPVWIYCCKRRISCDWNRLLFSQIY